MAKSTAKSIAQFRTLKEKLQFRIAGSSTIDTITESMDANGWPMLTLSDGGVVTAGNPVILLRMKAQNAVSKDVFGNDLIAFTPHTIELAYELDGTEGEPSRLDLAKVMHEISKMGIKLEIKEIADATAVTESSLNAAAVALSLEYEVTWPTSGI